MWVDWTWTGPRLVGVEGTPLEVHGVATLEIPLVGKPFLVDFVVVAVLRTQSILHGSGFYGDQSMCGQRWAENTPPQGPWSANANSTLSIVHHTIISGPPGVHLCPSFQ